MHNSSLNQAIEIYTYLLENGELTYKKGTTDLYDYYDNEEVKAYLNTISVSSKVTIEKIQNTIYLIPNINNTFLGYSKTDIRKKVFKGSMTQEEYYVFMFALLVTIQRFYSTLTNDAYISSLSIGEIIESIDKKLASFNDENVDKEININISTIKTKWNNLRIDSDKAREKKSWYIDRVAIFMEENKLINYTRNDKRIHRTKRFDNLSRLFLTSRRYRELQEYLDEGEV